METRGKQVAVGVADQNGFNNDDPAKAAVVFHKDLPGTPQPGEVLVRPNALHNAYVCLSGYADLSCQGLPCCTPVPAGEGEAASHQPL